MQPYYQSLQPISLSGHQLDQLLSLGWYRMNQDIFTTSHVHLGGLYRVHWLRYSIDEISKHASHIRIRQKAKKFSYRIDDFDLSEDHHALYSIYRSSIDFQGSPSVTDCLFGEEAGISSIYTTKTISIYDGFTLVGAGYFDLGKVGAASILHFFNPNYKRYSLGKYLILLTIDWLKQHGFDFYYPGYIVEGNPKMDYKLFLGKECAQYFDPVDAAWKRYVEMETLI